MKTPHCFLIVVIMILILPDLVAQDITGDWYGVYQKEDTLQNVTIHIYKDRDGLKAKFDNPDHRSFGYPIDIITFKKDTLFYRISILDITYKGHVSQDFSIINGELTKFGTKWGLDFGRKRLKRIVPVNYNSMTVMPAEVRVVKAGPPKRIPYSGIRIVEAGIPNVIKIDTSDLNVLTPGKGTVGNPRMYKLPESVTKDEYPDKAYYFQFAPVILRAKQSEPVQAQPMRMKDIACFNIQYLDIEQGLNDPMIWSMLEDSRGNMWFGSESSGLFKYDWKSFTYYSTSEGLTNNGIRALIEDRDGNIWIGTDWGLCKYDGKYFTQYPGELFTQVLSILESKNGNLWFGTSNGLFNKKGDLWIHNTKNEGLINNTVWTIAEDKNGNLWLGTDGGVCKYDGVSFTHFTEKEGLISNNVRKIIQDRYGNLWFGTGLSATKYDGKSFSQYTEQELLSGNGIQSIMEDDNGNLWFGTYGGLTVYDGNHFTQYTTRDGLNNNSVLSIIEDKSKNIWLGTLGGVMKLQRNSFTYFNKTEDLGKGGIGSIFEDHNGNICFSNAESIIRFNGESFFVLTDLKSGNPINIKSMLEDKEGNIWFVGTPNPDLGKYDGKSVAIYSNKELWKSIYGECMLDNINGNIWIGTWGDGIKIFDGKTFTSLPGLASSAGLTTILRDNNGDIWFGNGPYGLFRYDGIRITGYNSNEGLYNIKRDLSDLWIYSLFEDKTGNLWIGIKDGGVCKFNGSSFTYFTEKEGLSNNTVNSIIEDNKGNIWAGTKKGLSLLTPRKDGTYSITSFGNEDLKEVSFNKNSVCLDSRNRLWWGTGDIVTMLDLNTFEVNAKPPEVHLNNILINQKYIDFMALLPGIKETGEGPSDKGTILKMRGLKFTDVAPFFNYPVDLVLPHYLNNVTFNFSAIDWTAPQSIRYQYIVEGMDEDWNPLTIENKADYRNIPSGRHTFKVKAISTANIWSETFEYPFTVRPPWWLQWWAYIVYVIILILLVGFYIRYRIGRERIKAEIQFKQLEVDKMQELDEMKSRFFANISHEFRTPLTLIIGPIEDLFKRKPERAELSWDIMGIIRRNAKRLQRLINQMLDLSRLETGKVKLQVSEGNFEDFLKTIILSFLSLAESKHIRYEYNLPETVQNRYFDRDKVEKITTNLISNALKFTQEGGSVMVTLQYFREKNSALEKNLISEKNIVSGSYAVITVKDTGPGIPDDEKEKIFNRFYQVSSSDTRDHEGSGIGLALARELVELYRGEIHVESEIGKGSIFTVKLPVSREKFREDEIVAVSEKTIEMKLSDEQEIAEQETVTTGVQRKTDKRKGEELPIILIVEDNTDLRRYISGNLNRQYQILEAENGRVGLDKAIESIPDLVISDLMMPEMDGKEMCNRLKSDKRTNHIPLIMLTAKADRESKLESLETGADDYIIKPFDAEELQVRVKNLIEQRKKLREKYRKEFLADPAGHEMHPPQDEFLVRLMECTKKHFEDPEFSVKKLGEELNLSQTQLYRKVISVTDYTPNEFIRNIRLKTAARMFREGHRNITSVLYTVGFSTPSHFTECFRELYGMNPSEYIKLSSDNFK